MNSAACFAVLTPPGRGAVATVALTGPGALEVLARCFRPAKGAVISSRDVGRVRLGHFSSAGGMEEELVVSVLPSTVVTGELEIAIHPHGGTAAVAAVSAALEAAGAVPLSLEAWAVRSEPDLLAAEARLALGQARTERTTRILLDQYRGALRQELLAILALLSWDDAPHLSVLRRLEALLQSSRSLRLTAPWRVVLTGKPNAGKSSLLNALLGFQRAITHDEAGTTRDVVTAETAFDGWPIELRDTAGLRAPGDELEAAGVARAHEEIAAADLVLLVIDCRDDYPREIDRFLGEFPATASRLLAIRSQSDLLGEVGETAANPALPLLTSAPTRQGLAELERLLVHRLVPEPPPLGAPVAFHSRQFAALDRAVEAVRSGDFSSACAVLADCLGGWPAEKSAATAENALRAQQQSLE